MSIKELRETRAKIVEDARALLAGDISAEVESRFDTMMAEADALKAKIDREERLADAEASLETRIAVRAAREDISHEEARQKGFDESATFRSFLKGGMEDLSSEQRQFMLSKRAQSVGTNTAGGYTVPAGFLNRLVEVQKAFGGMRSVASVLTTESGNSLAIPNVNETTQTGSILGENVQVSDQDATFGQMSLGAYKYTSGQIKISLELLQDSAFDLEGYLTSALGTRIARITNTHFTTGDGSSKPKGIILGAGAGKTAATGQTTSVTYDDLVDLFHSVDPAYRANATWMFADSTLKALRKLKDSQGLPIWQPGMVAGEPDLILGRRYTINQDVPAMAANAKSIMFGDMSKYIIRDVLGVQVVRLAERYADYAQVGFLALSRHDGALVDGSTSGNGNAVKYFANSAT